MKNKCISWHSLKRVWRWTSMFGIYTNQTACCNLKCCTCVIWFDFEAKYSVQSKFVINLPTAYQIWFLQQYKADIVFRGICWWRSKQLNNIDWRLTDSTIKLLYENITDYFHSVQQPHGWKHKSVMLQHHVAVSSLTWCFLTSYLYFSLQSSLE